MGQIKKQELERRLEQSRRLLKEAPDPMTRDRLTKLTSDLEDERQKRNEE
jgi:hypothetical protein